MTTLAVRTRIALLAVAALAVSAPLLLAGAPAAAYPLDRRLSLDVWGGRIEEVAAEIQRQTGVGLAYFPPDFPEERKARKIYLVTGDISLRTAMECLSRRFGCRYRLAESGRVEMTTGYGWADPAAAMRFNVIDDLIEPGKGDESAMRNIREILRVLPLLNEGFSQAAEVSPAPGGGRSVKIVAVLPTPAADNLDAAISALKGGDGAAAPSPGPHPPRAPRSEPLSWKRLFATPVELSGVASAPRQIMRAVCARLDMALMLNGDPGAAANPVKFSGRLGFGVATEEIAGLAGLPRRVLLNHGAIVFEPGRKGEWEEDSRSREFFWTGLAVAGFDAARLAGRLGTGNLAPLLKRTVFPEVWLDPMCVIVHNEATRRLAVIAPGNVVEAVAAEMRRLEVR